MTPKVSRGVIDFGPDQEAGLEWLARQVEKPKKCFLCSKPAKWTGVFIPHNPQEFGAPEGKDRFLIYGLCEDHPPSDLIRERIEKALVSSVRVN